VYVKKVVRDFADYCPAAVHTYNRVYCIIKAQEVGGDDQVVTFYGNYLFENGVREIADDFSSKNRSVFGMADNKAIQMVINYK
jgi:hypothetical protein